MNAPQPINVTTCAECGGLHHWTAWSHRGAFHCYVIRFCECGAKQVRKWDKATDASPVRS